MEKEFKPNSSNKNLEGDKLSDAQKEIEKKIEQDEENLTGETLSGELSKDRTHMSEHRTRMSEHRTDMSEHRTELSEYRTNLSDTRTQMSYERTALSYERTLMSWIRTSTSMITFGFTLYKVFEEFQQGNTETRFFSPRVVGIIMIAFGFLGLLFAQIQHRMAYKKLKQKFPELQPSLSSILSALVLAFGLLLFFVALFRQ